MKKANATHENDNRSRNNPINSAIYSRFKEEELSQLTDEEFEILQTKIKPIHGPSTNAFLWDFHENGFKSDETTLNVCKRLMAAHQFYHPCFENYSRIFTFCRKIGITNLYDIGCGNQLQALLLIYAPEMNYTGIDDAIFHDYSDSFIAEPDYINELFEKFTNSSRIKHIKETYPFDLTTAENNIAICLAVFSGIFANAEKMKNLATALSRDFERVVLTVPIREYNLIGVNIKDIVYNEVEVWKNPFEEYYSILKGAMPEFEFYKIGEQNFTFTTVFGTKISEDRNKLEKNYTIVDNQLLTGIMDISWHQSLLQ